jgi:hypothetical protein
MNVLLLRCMYRQHVNCLNYIIDQIQIPINLKHIVVSTVFTLRRYFPHVRVSEISNESIIICNDISNTFLMKSVASQ